MALRAPEADAAFVKACCADLWAHPGIRLLAGESLHPGGLDLSRRAVERAGWTAEDRVLNVGTGPGATEEWMAARGIRPIGIDYSAALATQAAARVPAARFAVADGERLPFLDGSFDGVLAECVLSVIPDVEQAAAEAHRVLRPGGRMAVSDVTRSGDLPAELETFVSWIACAAGALPAEGYAAALGRAGFQVVLVEDHSGALGAMVAKARRRLALFDGSVAAGLIDLGPTGLDPGLVQAGRMLLGSAAETVEAGRLGYTLVVAERRDR